MGPDPGGWSWGRLHALSLKHFLSGRGDLGRLLDRGGQPVRGDATTVCNSSPDADHAAFMGASYRMVADLADPRRGIWAVGLAGASGHPGSPHYADQVAEWCEGGYHYLPMDDPGGKRTTIGSSWRLPPDEALSPADDPSVAARIQASLNAACLIPFAVNVSPLPAGPASSAMKVL